MLFWVSVDVYKQGCNQPLFEIMYKYYFNPQRVHACLASHGKHQRFEPVPKVCQCSVQKSAKAQWRKTKKEEKKKRKKRKKKKGKKEKTRMSRCDDSPKDVRNNEYKELYRDVRDM
jgi:hypothetical protein